MKKFLVLFLTIVCFSLYFPLNIMAIEDKAPKVGLNFIRFFWDESEGFVEKGYNQPEWIFNDFKELGVQTYRQIVKADLQWDTIEPQKGQWNFTEADAVLNNDEDFIPIVTLFTMQYASPNPPWKKKGDVFEKHLTDDTKEYLTKIVERYGDKVKYWELGNEMDHWRAVDANGELDPRAKTDKYPELLGAFSISEQAQFLAETASFIKEIKPDAVIVMPGIASLENYSVNVWFQQIIDSAGTDWFDIINYHYYDSWELLAAKRKLFQEFIVANGMEDKPVWLTETGSSNDKTLTVRTNYPNSSETQAADIFRRFLISFSSGDSNVMLHTYIGNEGPQSNWRGYGIRNAEGDAQEAYATFQLFTEELMPIKKVEVISSTNNKQYIFKITRQDNEAKYVAWGQGDYLVPSSINQKTSVVAANGSESKWQKVSQGDIISLTEIPVLLSYQEKSDNTNISMSNVNNKIETKENKNNFPWSYVIIASLAGIVVILLILLFRKRNK